MVLSCVLISIYWHESQPHDLEVYYLDVGQGDAILIRTPDNQDILIDGGPDNNVLLYLGQILPFWDRDIELMILTHPHDDHVAGLVDVLERYEVKQIIYEQVEYDNPNYKKFQELIVEKNIPHRESFYGDQLELSENLYLETIYPFANIDLNEIENVNDTSIINRLIYKENKFLFTGDAEIEVEEMILHNNIDIQANILKAGHHGSKTASSQEFLETVLPEQVIIQCGQNNKFNHPHFITLYKLKQLGISVLRNDLDGTIMCESNGIDANCKKML